MRRQLKSPYQLPDQDVYAILEVSHDGSQHYPTISSSLADIAMTIMDEVEYRIEAVVKFNAAEGWVRDASEEACRLILVLENGRKSAFAFLEREYERSYQCEQFIARHMLEADAA